MGGAGSIFGPTRAPVFSRDSRCFSYLTAPMVV